MLSLGKADRLEATAALGTGTRGVHMGWNGIARMGYQGGPAGSVGCGRLDCASGCGGTVWKMGALSTVGLAGECGGGLSVGPRFHVQLRNPRDLARGVAAHRDDCVGGGRFVLPFAESRSGGTICPRGRVLPFLCGDGAAYSAGLV